MASGNDHLFYYQYDFSAPSFAQVSPCWKRLMIQAGSFMSCAFQYRVKEAWQTCIENIIHKIITGTVSIEMMFRLPSNVLL